MITPPYLKPGDKIGIVAPARKVTQAEMEPGISFLQAQGFEVVTGKNLYGNHYQFSGTDNERAADLQSMMDDKSIRAILAARGGYGSVRIVDEVEMDHLMEDPKWLCGFSDFTVFHHQLHHYLGIESLHAPMLFNLHPERFDQASAGSLVSALKGERMKYEVTVPDNLSLLNKNGGSEGLLVGGNLSVMYSLLGSSSDIDTRGKILFLEDLDEYLYHIDRMMMALKRTSKLEHLVGIIVGGMNDMKDNAIPYGKTAEEIIREHVQGYDYPVCFGFPAGHESQNLSLILGRTVDLTVAGPSVTLEFMEAEPD